MELCFEGCVEFGHALDGQRFFDAEGVVQDADWGGGLGYLDRVVDVADDGPAGGLGEVGGAFEDEGGREVFCYGLDLVAGGTGVEAVSMAVFDVLGWRYLREAKVAYLRAVAALVSWSEFQGLLAINDDFEGAVRQDLVCEGLQALGHALLQFLITQVKVQGVRNSGDRFGDVLMSIVRLRAISFHRFWDGSHLARVLDKVASHKFGLPLLALAESSVV